MNEFLDQFSPDFVEHIRNADDDRVKYLFRSRTTGTREYICMFCGHNNKFRISPHNWTHRCGNSKCRRWIGFGDIAYVLPHYGVRLEPPDRIIPRGLIEMYPEGDIGRWNTGQPVNVIRILKWPW